MTSAFIDVNKYMGDLWDTYNDSGFTGHIYTCDFFDNEVRRLLNENNSLVKSNAILEKTIRTNENELFELREYKDLTEQTLSYLHGTPTSSFKLPKKSTFKSAFDHIMQQLKKNTKKQTLPLTPVQQKRSLRPRKYVNYNP